MDEAPLCLIKKSPVRDRAGPKYKQTKQPHNPKTMLEFERISSNFIYFGLDSLCFIVAKDQNIELFFKNYTKQSKEQMQKTMIPTNCGNLNQAPLV